MRNFTLFLIFMLIGAISFAQQPVVTPVWDHSVYGTADWSSGIPIGGETPEWMGNITERGMAHYDGKLYILSRNENPLVVVQLDALTGEHLSSMPIDTSVVKGGTYPANDIVITPSGKILVSSLAIGHTSPFKVYMLEDNGEGGYDATNLLEWYTTDTIEGVEQPTMRLGDSFAFYGEISEEEDGYLLVADATATEEQKVLKWNVQAGVFTTEPVEIIISEVLPAPEEGAVPKFSTTPRLWTVSDDLFWADGHATLPALYNMQGELISTFTGEDMPVQAGVSGVSFFSFQEYDFMLAPTTNWANPTGYPPNAFQLFQIPAGGAEEADSIAIFPEIGMGKESNASFSYPIALDIQEEMVMMYVMVPNNGIAAYKLTMEDEVSDSQEWNISNPEFNELGSLTETIVVDGLTIYAAAGKNVDIDGNNKTLEDWSFTHRLKFGGSGGFDEDGKPVDRALAFDVPGNSKITIALQSSSGSTDRILNVAVNHEDSILAEVPALGADISKGEVEYMGGPATIYLYSPSSGVNIYLIKVESLTVNAPIINNPEEVRIFPNPATDRVFVNITKPTQVAIYNMGGSMVKSRLVQSKNDYIDVSDLQPGMYLIRSQMSHDFSQKLIVR